MAILPTNRRKLRQLAKEGNTAAIAALEALKGKPTDPFCHASGKRCPAVPVCQTSQRAKRIHDGKASFGEKLFHAMMGGEVYEKPRLNVFGWILLILIVLGLIGFICSL